MRSAGLVLADAALPGFLPNDLIVCSVAAFWALSLETPANVPEPFRRSVSRCGNEAVTPDLVRPFRNFFRVHYCIHIGEESKHTAYLLIYKLLNALWSFSLFYLSAVRFATVGEKTVFHLADLDNVLYGKRYRGDTDGAMAA